MELTIEYLNEKFELYNKKYFYGLLKKPYFTGVSEFDKVVWQHFDNTPF